MLGAQFKETVKFVRIRKRGQVSLENITKIEAAERQINAAIQMMFESKDPLAVHSLAMAGFGIVRDLGKKKSVSIHQKIEDRIAPGKIPKFWQVFRRSSNFLKHADHFPDGILETFNEAQNPLLLFISSAYFFELTKRHSQEMLVLMSWVSLKYPNFLLEGHPLKGISFNYLPRASESEQLEFGNAMLKKIKSGVLDT